MGKNIAAALLLLGILALPLPAAAGSAAILTPADGATVAGYVTVTSSLPANVGCTAYYLDGATVLHGLIITAPYTFYWDTTKVANGPHTLTAGGCGASSPPVVLTINNPVPPPAIPVPAPVPVAASTTVLVTSPAYGSTLSSSVVLSAQVTGDIGCVAYTMEGSGYISGCQVTPPYRYVWDASSVAPGTHTITAGAWDRTTGAYLVASPPVVVGVPAPAPAPIRVTSPTGGESWAVGSTQTITWTGGDPGWPILIQVIDSAKWQVAKTLASNAANSGSFPWVVDMPAGTYQVYVQGDRGRPDSSWDYGHPFSVPAPAAAPASDSVTILSPAGGASVAGFVSLTAAVTGSVGSVAYTLDGSGYLDGVIITAPYTFYWDTTKVANGTHTLTAGGWDKDTGRWAAGSAPVAVTVGNPVPPPAIPVPAPVPVAASTSVVMLSPAYGSTLSSSVVLSAQVTGDIGCVAYTMEGSGYISGCQVTPPYRYVWDASSVAPGTHTITAGAWDRTTGAYLVASPPVVVGVPAPAPAPIRITSPTGGESWALGSTQTITWTGGDPGWPILIQVIDSAKWQVAKTLASNAANSGSFPWVVDMPAGTYQVYVQGDRGRPDSSWDYGHPFSVPAPAAPPAPDSVTILSPAGGASVAGFVSLTAAVTGSVGSVAYTLDGSGYLDGVIITAPYTFYWDTTKVANGTHTLTAGGWDKDTGRWAAASAPVAVTVGNPVPPPAIPVPAPVPVAASTTVLVTSPAYGAVLSSTVVLTASVTGDVGCVAYTLDGTGYLDACLNTPPYRFVWDASALTPGTHTVTAGAWDRSTGHFLLASPPVVVGVPAPPHAAPVRASIKEPGDGKHVSGNRVLVMAELVEGAPERTEEVRFQYRAAGSARWEDLVGAVAEHPNPDREFPYFVQWDVTALSSGSYQLRAVATGRFGGSDLAPASVTVVVDPVGFDEKSTDLGGGSVKKEQKVDNSKGGTVAAAASDGGVVSQVKLPAGALASSSTMLTVTLKPAAAPPAAAAQTAVGAALQVELGNGQHDLLGGETASLVFTYPDTDGDGVVDGTPYRAERLEVRSFVDGAWRKESETLVDRKARTLTATTPHFSFFQVFAAAAPDLDSVRVYPNPYRPGGGDPNRGRAYSPSDPLSGILFDNLPASVKVEVYTVTGKRVASFGADGGTGTLQWDVRNSDGRPVASGGYFAVISSPGRTPVVKKLGVVR